MAVFSGETSKETQDWNRSIWDEANGIFVSPVVSAGTRTLLTAWVDKERLEAADGL